MGTKNNRLSNIELLRILAMMGIVASHFLFYVPPETDLCQTPLAFFITMQGIWGKIGINIFVLISGYFMCTKAFSLKKYVKLWIEIIFYNIVIRAILMITGKVPVNFFSIVDLIFPWRRIGIHYFIPTFMVFYLITPFIKLLINKLSKRQHGIIIIILLGVYVGYCTLPTFFIEMDALAWFTILYLISGYVRLYGFPIKDKSVSFWSICLFMGIIFAIASIFFCVKTGYREPRYYSGNANSIFSVWISISSFMLFRNIKIPYNKIINNIASTTFGVLLIHSNNVDIRRWILIDIFDTPHILEKTFSEGMLYFSISVILVFIVCSIIDMARIKWIEPQILTFLDKKLITH